MTRILAGKMMLEITCAHNKKHKIPTTVLEHGLVVECPKCKRKTFVNNWGGGFDYKKFVEKR